MFSLAALRVAVCGFLLAADWGKVGGAEAPTGSLPVPSLSSRKPDVQLFSKVELLCTPPRDAPYPIVLILGRDTQPRTEVSSFDLRSVDGVWFSFLANAENEGLYVCWYNVSRTAETSGSSNSVNITISSVPPPEVSIEPKDFIPVGGKYMVYCTAPSGFSNITLSLYYRDLQSSAPQELHFLGSLTTLSGIQHERTNVPAGLKLEYLCRMQVVSGQRIYESPLSTSVTATAEEAPVRLVTAYPGPRCAGRLQMLVRGFWAPVCQDRRQTQSEQAAAALVACRQLGCGGVALTSYVSVPRLQRGEFVMGPVKCNGTEASLRDCSMISAFSGSCSGGQQVEIVCSAFLPPPQLTVGGYGLVSSVYVYEKHPLELSCSLVSDWLTNARVEWVEVRGGRSYSGMGVSPGVPAKLKLDPPVREGQYVCYVSLYSFNLHATSGVSNSVIVTTGSYLPPSAGLIAGALLTSLAGAGILVYMCACRVRKQGSQEHLEPQQTQAETPAAASWVDPNNTPGGNVGNPQANTQYPETAPGNGSESHLSAQRGGTENPGFPLGDERT